MSKRHSSHLFSFSAGLVVGLVSISISIIFKVFAGGLFLPELASQTLFSLTPGEFESQAIETLGPLAKYSTFIASIIVTTIIFGIFGIILDKLFYKFNLLNQYILKAISSFTLTYGTLVIISLILVTIIQLRSGSQTISIPFVILSLIPSQIAVGLIFPLFLRKSKDKGERQPYPPQQQKITENTKEEHYNRRDFIRLVLASVVSIPIIYFGLNRLFSPLQDIEQQNNNKFNLIFQIYCDHNHNNKDQYRLNLKTQHLHHYLVQK